MTIKEAEKRIEWIDGRLVDIADEDWSRKSEMEEKTLVKEGNKLQTAINIAKEREL